VAAIIRLGRVFVRYPPAYPMTSKHLFASLLLALFVALGVGCSHNGDHIRGTGIQDDPENEKILEACEQYRVAVEKQDTDALVLMAAPSYWEDRGTVESADDYGYDGLREVLAGRFQLASEVRYGLRYDKIRRACPHGGSDLERGCRAHVEVQIDASFTVSDASGQPVRHDKRDQNELVLEWDGQKWLFVSGM
jgi:hypothetical protein